MLHDFLAMTITVHAWSVVLGVLTAWLIARTGPKPVSRVVVHVYVTDAATGERRLMSTTAVARKPDGSWQPLLVDDDAPLTSPASVGDPHTGD